jgi:Zinc finger C-x8-C-x5-C-x3-H type (and similar)/Zinc finger, C3HC4 type (RING finger)
MPVFKRPRTLLSGDKVGRALTESDDEEAQIQIIRKKLTIPDNRFSVIGTSLETTTTPSVPPYDLPADADTVRTANEAIKKAIVDAEEASFIEKGSNSAAKGTDAFGREDPSKPSASFERQRARFHNGAMSVRVDYQPHICKDYYETGYCGYGDACIFMHDRSEIKMSWQLEKEWDLKKIQEKHKIEAEKLKAMRAQPEDTSWQDFCPLCGTSFEDVVRTPCGHYYCETCLIKAIQEAKSKKVDFLCRVCRAATHQYKPYQKQFDILRAKMLAAAHQERVIAEKEAGANHHISDEEEMQNSTA